MQLAGVCIPIPINPIPSFLRVAVSVPKCLKINEDIRPDYLQKIKHLVWPSQHRCASQ